MVSGRALALLIKRGNNPIVVPCTGDVEENNVVNLDGGAGDASKGIREKKRSRHEKDPHQSRRHLQKGTTDSAVEKALIAGSTSQNAETDSSLLGERAESIMIEISPEARWNLRDQQPLQAFGAFRLDRDASSYEGFSREEILLRSRRRLGMFISDYERLVGDGKLRVSHEREMASLRKELSDANHKLCTSLSREEEAEKKLEAEARGRLADKESFEKQIAQLEEEMGRCRLHRDEIQRERDAAKASNVALVNEVAALKKSLAEGDEELVNSLAGGYNACLERLVAVRVDGTGHSFKEYCADLRAEQAGDGEKD